MKKSFKIVIGLIVVIIIVGLCTWYAEDKKEVSTRLSQEDEQELRTAVFEQVGPRSIKVIGFDREETLGTQRHYSIIGPKDIEEVMTIEAVDDSGTAAKGKFFDQYGLKKAEEQFFWGDWIAWKNDQDEWSVAHEAGIGSSEEKFLCYNLDLIPDQFREFFQDEISSRLGEGPCMDDYY